MEDNITFEEFLNNSLKEIKEGQTVTGKIISVNTNVTAAANARYG